MLHDGLCHDCRNEEFKLKLSASDIKNLILEDMETTKTEFEHYDSDCQCLQCTIRKVLAWTYATPENSSKICDWVFVNSATKLLVKELQTKSLRCTAFECKCYVHDKIPAKGCIQINSDKTAQKCTTNNGDINPFA